MASGHGHGGMSLSMKLVRLLIVLFNLAFIVAGIALLAIGVYVVKDPKLQQLRPLLNPNLTSAYSQSFSYIEIFAIAIIVIGGVLLGIGFLGNKNRNYEIDFHCHLCFRLLWSNQRFSISSCPLCCHYWRTHRC